MKEALKIIENYDNFLFVCYNKDFKKIMEEII